MKTGINQIEPTRVVLVDAETELCALDAQTHRCVPKAQLFKDSNDLVLTGCFLEGHYALTHLPKLQPDIVLINPSLPDISGVECVRRLALAGKDLRLMMIADAADGPLVIQALMAGARGFLIKPFTLAELARGIRTLRQEGVFLCARAIVLLTEFLKLNHAVQGVPEMFTAREAEIFTYLVGRLSDKEIQEHLQQHQHTLSLRTIQNHVGHILRKLQAHSREEAVRKWIGEQGME